MKNKVDEVYNKSKKGLCIFLAFVMCVSLLSFAGSYRKAAAEEKNIEFDVENIKDYNVSIHDSGVFTLVNYTSEKGDVESVKWSVSDENIMKVTDIENLGAQYDALFSGKDRMGKTPYNCPFSSLLYDKYNLQSFRILPVFFWYIYC